MSGFTRLVSWFLKNPYLFFKEDLVFSVPAGSLRKQNGTSLPAAVPAALGPLPDLGTGMPGSWPRLGSTLCFSSPLCAEAWGFPFCIPLSTLGKVGLARERKGSATGDEKWDLH